MMAMPRRWLAELRSAMRGMTLRQSLTVIWASWAVPTAMIITAVIYRDLAWLAIPMLTVVALHTLYVLASTVALCTKNRG